MLNRFWKKFKLAVHLFREDFNVESELDLDYLLKTLEEDSELSLDYLLFDSLTGLLRREYFKKKVWPKQVEIAERYDREISLGVIDIDNLKRINDQEGHLIGDRAIERVAEAIEEITRDADFLCRYGGDEFVIMFPETSKKEAEEAISRIKEILGEKNEEAEKIEVKFSCAIAEFGSKDNFQSIFERADHRMYQNKKSKR